VADTNSDLQLHPPKRVELGLFLRSRRERLTPVDVGLAGRSRRRVRGLLREEVAQLADVSVTWYTWLEQGRPVRVSERTLRNIARALQMTIAETTHLFLLAERAPDVRGGEDVGEEMRRLLAQIGPNPAYITNNCWDVLATNDAAAAGLFDFTGCTGIERNFVFDILTNPQRQAEIVDWESFAWRTVVSLRYGFARYHDDRYPAIIDQCFAASEAFRQWWTAQEVSELGPGRIEVRHPQLGAIAYTYVSLRATVVNDLRLTIYTPETPQLARRLQSAMNAKFGPGVNRARTRERGPRRRPVS